MVGISKLVITLVFIAETLFLNEAFADDDPPPYENPPPYSPNPNDKPPASKSFIQELYRELTKKGEKPDTGKIKSLAAEMGKKRLKITNTHPIIKSDFYEQHDMYAIYNYSKAIELLEKLTLTYMVPIPIESLEIYGDMKSPEIHDKIGKIMSIFLEHSSTLTSIIFRYVDFKKLKFTMTRDGHKITFGNIKELHFIECNLVTLADRFPYVKTVTIDYPNEHTKYTSLANLKSLTNLMISFMPREFCVGEDVVKLSNLVRLVIEYPKFDLTPELEAKLKEIFIAPKSVEIIIAY